MIRSYGLHWHIEKVNWGHPGVAGTLLGAERLTRNCPQIDFRDQRGIYALYADYDLVYVGQVGSGNQRLFNRLKGHLRGSLSERWNRFSWFGTRWVTGANRLSADAAAVNVTTEIALNILEAVSIAISEPRLNLQRGEWGNAIRYRQVPWGGEPDDDDVVEEE